MLTKNEKRNAEKISREKWESLTLGNGFIFSKVMLNEVIFRGLNLITTFTITYLVFKDYLL